ncbi:hypothetical protein K0504_07210 [Neiella marina]|uniref:Uncharacterized protein n=1 Tax=Neiella holothuriorum TaxID=2870530 RepID=A0ABS7EEQ1_9GAMM|nr:hypothetical protein [Neiella holothuriorum]MBW8190819.1 hypothetical protein [Neiella holothuriorum]
MGKPVIAIDSVAKSYPPNEYAAFVAVGYQELNTLRESKVEQLTTLGYQLVSYYPQHTPINGPIGHNSMIMDDAVIQPCVTVGNNVLVWGGAMVGHHSVLQDHCWISGGCAIGGGATIGERTFVGINATLGNAITVGRDAIIGSGAICNKCIAEGSVLITAETPTYRLNSHQFIRFSSEFNSRN